MKVVGVCVGSKLGVALFRDVFYTVSRGWRRFGCRTWGGDGTAVICFELKRMTVVLLGRVWFQLYWTMECGSGLFDCQALSDSGEKAKRVLMKR